MATLVTATRNGQHWSLWACTDCHEAHHSGEIDPNHYGPEPWGVWDAGKVTDNTTCVECWKGQVDCDHNTETFSNRPCDGCGTWVAGARYKFESI